MKKLNFKWCVYILVLAVIFPMFSVMFPLKNQARAINDFSINKLENEITCINGDFAGFKIDSYEDALDVLNEFKHDFGFESSKDALCFNREIPSVTGKVYRFYQCKEGYKVYNSEVIVNVNNDGRVMSINCSYYTNINSIEQPKYSMQQAKEKVLESYDVENISYLEMNIMPKDKNCLAYIFEVYMDDDFYKVFVNASDLSIVKIIKTAATLTSASNYIADLPSLANYTKEDSTTTYTNINGETVTLSIDKYTSKTTDEYFFILGDSERAIYVTHGENQKDNNGLYYTSYNETATFNDVIAVRAYDYIMKCYDFYLDSTNFGVSIEGLKNPKGQDILLLAIVHYDNKYENAAFYLPTESATTGYFYFGDGNINNNTGSFVNGLDVVGHEYQHCITDTVVQLEYFNEAGAICEAYSDIFGAVIEGKEMSDSEFWWMGEDIYVANNKYFRDMSNPSITGCTSSYENLYPLCTSNTCSHTNCDNGGVHYNSTLMTYATYIMYQQDPVFFNESNILKLWYQTLTKLSEDSTFIEFAEKMLQSARELGFSEEKLLNIEFAFASIDLPGYTGIKVWNDYSLQYLQGSGTIAYPYLINSVADLASVAYYVNTGEDLSYASARYQLNVDLDLNNIAWVGIGTKEIPFNGVFNGGGKTIRGLNIQTTEGDKYAGLFKYTGDDSYIYDVRVGAGTTSSIAEYSGAVAGLLKGTISGCSSELNITGNKVGGIVGLVLNSSGGEKIVNSIVAASLEGSVVGGLAAEMSTPINNSVNLHLSGYITSSYTTGTLKGSVVGGIVGRANAVYLANVITLSTIYDLETGSVVGGVIGELYFKDINNLADPAIDIISNMLLSVKVASSFNITSSETKTGLLMGEFKGGQNEGTLYVENVVAKKQGDIDFSSTDLNLSFVKFKNLTTSEDKIYEGDFDFDSEKYFKNTNNWSVLEGIEAFDLVSTYKMNGSNSLPKFTDSDFWLNHSANKFASGEGTEESPYIIETAEQLALFASVVGNEYYNANYSTKHYKLGADIDLAGKIWVGIGASHSTIMDGMTVNQVICPFRGVFDGAGYSIINMSAISAYSVSPINSTGTYYKLTEYLPSLFGVVFGKEDETEVDGATIKNIKIEHVNNRGSYAAGVVSKVYLSANLENVSVIGGNITSNFISGGLIATIDGINQTTLTSDAVSSIINCHTHVNVSGRISGGAVGYATNASHGINSTLNIINYLNRGTISVSGEEIDSIYINGSSYYYRPMAGSVIGINLVKNSNIINTINLGDVISYNNSGYLGGFVGSIGVGSIYVSDEINIVIDGSKQVGKIYYIFDGEVLSSGNIIGGTHDGLTSNLNLTIKNTTYSSLNTNIIYENNMAETTIEDNLIVSTDELGSGDFDVYNTEYYSDENYFNLEYVWSEDQQAKLFVAVTFRDFSGEIISVIYLQQGQTTIGENEVPTPSRLPTVQYEYVFTGWDKDLTNITQSMSVYAEYDTKVREYSVTYKDAKGNVVETKQITFGSSVNQDVKAPKKESGLIFKYKFLRWGEKGQTVTGDMDLKPVYERELTFFGKVLVVSFIIFGLALCSISHNKKKEY